MYSKEVAERVINYISNRDQKWATYEKINMNVGNENLGETLARMVKIGDLTFSGKKYRVSNSEIREGVVSVTKNGIKQIKTDNGKVIPLSVNSFYNVLSGDKVKYRIIDKEAYVREIVDRRFTEQVFEVVFVNGKKALEYTQGNYSLKVNSESLRDYSIGEYVLVNVSKPGYEKIIKRIGNTSDPNNRDIILAYNHGFDNEYDEDYLRELANIKTDINEEILANREDYRGEEAITIDCYNTRDMDDAVWVKKLENGNWLYRCHIASISEFIPFGGAIFRKALKRGYSVYTRKSVFPLFHYVISNGICSLNPEEDRLTKTITLEIDNKGNVINKKLTYGVINSRKKMSYAECDKVYLGDETVDKSYLPYRDLLFHLKELADILGDNLKRHGKIELYIPVPNIKTDDLGQPINDAKIDGPIFRKVIEYLMIYANMAYTEILDEEKLPLWFRNHVSSDEKTISSCIAKIKNYGYDTSIYDKTKNLQLFLASFVNNPADYQIISGIILSGFHMANIGYVNLGHFGLGLDKYCRYTSGIRRGDDFLNHYSADAYITGNTNNIDKLRNLQKVSCDWFNRAEVESEAVEAESLIEDILDIADRNMYNCIEGIVIELHYDMAYVKLINGVYGIVRNNEVKLSVGDKINAKIIEVNHNRKEVYLSFLNFIKKRGSGKRRVRTK